MKLSRKFIGLGIAALALPAILGALPAAAQTQHPVKHFSSGADVAAMIAEAKASGGNKNILIANDEGYPVMMEFRVKQTNASNHPTQSELVEVLEGSCVLVTGGKLVDGAIQGGTSRSIAKGDYALIPSNTPHWFTQPQGLALMTIHMPVPAK
jgi:mannose-6-phosphate isomerase-like protein (cupin superfamily)